PDGSLSLPDRRTSGRRAGRPGEARVEKSGRQRSLDRRRPSRRHPPARLLRARAAGYRERDRAEIRSRGGSLTGWAGWHFANFGLILPLGAVGLFFLARERLLFALLVGGSLVIFESLRYRWTWDIAKFATVAALVLSFGASAALRRLFEL